MSPLPFVHEISPPPDPLATFSRFALEDHALFLDSAAGPPPLTRYSFVAAKPFLVVRARRGVIDVTGRLTFPAHRGEPLDALASLLEAYRSKPVPGLPPFQGGAAGYFAYDLCHSLERLPRPAHDDVPLPDMEMGFYDWVLAWDHEEHRSWIVSTGWPETGDGAKDRHARARAHEVLARLAGPEPPSFALEKQVALHAEGIPAFPFPTAASLALSSNFDRAGYLVAVRRVIDYIFAGDIFQANLSQRLNAHLPCHPFALYRELRGQNPAPFAAYLGFGETTIASASPERFLRLAGDQVETRPIKGTRPRGPTPREDERLRADLAASRKDRAENVMIVDLLRNDLSRVCLPGTVAVPELCAVESYATVHHLVSTVTGRLRPGEDAPSLLRAAFPGGSVTGAPKIRAMEIIAELEPTHRGVYCGAIGYLGFEGSMDTSIAIRTFVAKDDWVHFQAGGGIVARSDPEAEYEETIDKARALIATLEAMEPVRRGR